ncbi:hypothetical protein MHU86_18829 [Fragilaria crotonensis]|nr:hypothetical protein MHU86_18829 [Fragilaria crotonensis]
MLARASASRGSGRRGKGESTFGSGIVGSGTRASDLPLVLGPREVSRSRDVRRTSSFAVPGGQLRGGRSWAVGRGEAARGRERCLMRGDRCRRAWLCSGIAMDGPAMGPSVGWRESRKGGASPVVRRL